ncbi:MAG: NADH-quinone oxidoreductase subunit L [Candidatus Omnitrophica bacterium]|nr:NADH-quinone oxidoreductase subunit L [Candidatus Omnitrophota bacterium]
MTLLWIPLLPLLAFILNILVGRRLGRRAAWLSIAAIAASAAVSLRVGCGVAQGAIPSVSWSWLGRLAPAAAGLGGDALTLGLQADALTSLMLVVVTVIGTLIHLYSVGYMADDPRFSRFFAYLSLFCASMLLLVLADNLLFLYAGWELVGLCSYLLISFWFEKPAAAAAGRKAFLTTRIGDTGLLIGLFMLWTATGTVRFDRLLASLATMPASQAWMTAAAILVFCGAVGKSAQVPLHVWLPDAMEGPTPVSALIHAATMVAAGVYLVARLFPLFAAYPDARQVVMIIGTVTAGFAAIIACTMTDIKRILAYSTISQLGFMMSALGVGGYIAGMFHLATHACFKALLFLGAGSVIHATHTQELMHLGGLSRKMRVTALTMLVAALAMSGMPPLAGFWSKDEILTEAWHQGHPVVFSCLLLTSALTAFYIFRLWFVTFAGQPRDPQIHAHESPVVMTAPLVLLAFGSAVAGLPGSPWLGHWLHQRLLPHEATPLFDGRLAGLSTVAGLCGIGYAYLRYQRGAALVPLPVRAWGLWFVEMASHKFYIDELYGWLIIRPFLRLTASLSHMDRWAIDGLVNLIGLAGIGLSEAKDLFDRHVVDFCVNGVARAIRGVGEAARRLQTGFIQQYLWITAASVVALACWRMR